MRLLTVVRWRYDVLRGAHVLINVNTSWTSVTVCYFSSFLICAMESLSGNYISQLNEYQQKTQCAVEYEEVSTEGPSHNQTYGAVIL